MPWTRRGFVGLGFGICAGFALGFLGIKSLRVNGSMHFDETRSIPGETLKLQLQTSMDLRDLRVVLQRQDAGRCYLLQDLGSASVGELTVVTPYCKINAESYPLLASLVDKRGKTLLSTEPVEVIVRSFCYGM